MQTLCKKTFSATKDTAFYRIHKPQELVLMVLTLLAHGSAHCKRSWRPSASTSAPRGPLAKRGWSAVQKGA